MITLLSLKCTEIVWVLVKNNNYLSSTQNEMQLLGLAPHKLMNLNGTRTLRGLLQPTVQFYAEGHWYGCQKHVAYGHKNICFLWVTGI